MLPVAPRGHRAAAELAERALERVDSRLERGQHVREALAARVVEVRRQLDARQLARARARRTPRTCIGFAIPVVSPNAISSQPAVREPARRSRTPARAAPRPRRGSRTRPRSRPRSAGPASRARATTRSSPDSDSSIERLTFLRLCVSLADRNRLTSSNSRRPLAHQREPALEAALVRDQHRVGDAVGALDRAQHLLGVGELRDHVRRARTTSPRAAAGRSARGSRSGRPCRRSRSPRARSGSRRADRPRGCGRCSGDRPCP